MKENNTRKHRAKKINHLTFDELQEKLYSLMHHTHTDKEGRTINSPQHNSKYARHIMERMSALSGKNFLSLA